MSEEPTPRQVLYALVGGGFLVVVAVLTVAGAGAGLVPTWWSGVLALGIAAGGAWSARNWRKTVGVLLVAIGLFIVWLIGTLALAS